MPEVSGDLSCFSCGLRGGGLVRGFPRFLNFCPLPPFTLGPHDFLGNDHPTVLQQTRSTYITWHLGFLWFLLVFRPFWGGLVWGWYPPFPGFCSRLGRALRGVRILKIYTRLLRRLETLTLHFAAQ